MRVSLICAASMATSTTLAEEIVQPTYENQDFQGLYTYLDSSTCQGPHLMDCMVDKRASDGAEQYLKDVDFCLYENKCLSYHSILLYKQKLNEVSPLIAQTSTKVSSVKEETAPGIMQVRALQDSKLDDLQLSEVNYLCIRESVQEVTTAARQNMFVHCLDHIERLFQEGDFEQALNTTFVTQTASYSWQMITIFCVVFAILGVSVCLMCRFMKNKDPSKERGRRRNGTFDHHQRPARKQSREYDSYQSSERDSSGPKKQYRVPRAQARDSARHTSSGAPQGNDSSRHGATSAIFGEFDRGSGLNVPLLDYSEGTASDYGRDSSNNK